MAVRWNLSQIAAGAAVLGVVLALAGVLGARLRWLPPLAGLGLFVAALLLGGLVALAAGGGAVARRGAAPSVHGATGGGAAWLAAAAGVLLLAVLIGLAFHARRVPRIHDITTDPEDPPAFHEIDDLPPNRGRDLAYPHGPGDTTALQHRAYPDLEPIRLRAAPEVAFDAARRAAEELGWTIVWSSAAAGILEAYDETPLFRFADDVVVRVRRRPEGGSVVDVRSTSRVGQSDLGANAERIREFARALRAATGEGPP